MEDLIFWAGVMGNIISVLLLLAPVKTFIRIVKNGSTEEFDSLPYICTLVNTGLWTYFGIVKPGRFCIATINIFGDLIETIYVILFFIYAPPRMKAKTAILAVILDIGFLGAVILGMQFGMHGDMRNDAAGFLCAVFNIIMYASPLGIMKLVVTTKSVEFMPFLLSFIMFVNGGIWTAYALLVRDMFVIVPNGFGFLLGIAQLVLYAIYYKNPNTSKKKRIEGLDEGWQQHEHLISPLDRIEKE